MTDDEQEEIKSFLKSFLEDRISIKWVSFNFDLWALAISHKDDAETGRIFREYVNLCRDRQPESKQPETFASREALKGLAHAYAKKQEKRKGAYAMHKKANHNIKGEPKAKPKLKLSITAPQPEDFTDENPF